LFCSFNGDSAAEGSISISSIFVDGIGAKKDGIYWTSPNIT
jgi:hypothetical protein